MKTPISFASERGSALVATLLLLLLLLTLGVGTLLYSTYDLRATTHYSTGNQALYAAEAGLLRALNIINEPGVVDFEKDIVAKWAVRFSPNPQSIPGYPAYRYEVGVAADALSPATRGTITATGFALANARRVVRALVERDPASPGRGRGAIYLASDTITSQFSGNAFAIDGRDHDRFGSLVPGEQEPGIATRNDGVTNAVKASLNTQQKDNVKGLGYTRDPLNPSVVTTGGPSVSDLDQLIADLLARPGVVTDGSATISGNKIFGTVDQPQITHLTASTVNIHANGRASGAGILIVDGSFVINGTFDFIGWIIVRGATVINDTMSDDTETNLLGNATILGSLWTGALKIKVGGSAIAYYCSWCMRLADTASTTTGNVPKPVRVLSWEEVL